MCLWTYKAERCKMFLWTCCTKLRCVKCFFGHTKLRGVKCFFGHAKLRGVKCVFEPTKVEKYKSKFSKKVLAGNKPQIGRSVPK